ncbi:hypothetical protein CRUP_000412, partial [Coryphaenoides rupestris]
MLSDREFVTGGEAKSGTRAPSPVSVVRRGVSGRSSITVSWAEPDRPNGIILEYEIKYFEKVVPPSPVSVVRRGVSGRSSITVSWAEPDRPNGIILEYEIKYFEKRQDTVSTSHPEKQEKTLEGSRREQDSGYTIIKSQQTEMVVEGLKPSSAYIFQVRARTSAGYGAFSRRFEFQTSPYLAASSERAQASVVAVAITLVLVLLALVAGFLLSG